MREVYSANYAYGNDCLARVVPSYDEHKNRNDYNTDLPSSPTDAETSGWRDDVSASLHQHNTKEGPNTKWVSSDGKREVIFYSDGSINDTPEDRGTYNFAPSGEWYQIDKNIGHFFQDVLPYLFWGN